MIARLLIAALALFWSVNVLQHWWPQLTAGSIVYFLASALVLLILLLALAAGALLRIRAGERRKRWSRQLLLVAAAGLALFAISFAASAALRRSLPPGSFVREFDSAAWLHPDAAAYVEGDITPRQKMLGDLTRRVLPGKNRRQIEKLLGPGAPHGRDADLLYITGPERAALFAIDNELLLIRLDEAGAFEQYQISRD